jgi:collagenase-like PrtC family protease
LLREHGVGVDGGGDALAADWPIYITNRSAVRQALEMGVSRFVLAPDDGPDNIKALLAGCASRAVVLAHQDTPLFISGNCATASLAGRCPAHHGCRTAEKTVVSADGEGVRVIQKGCRTVVVADPTPGRRSLARELAGAGAVRFRADFINRQYSAAEVRTIWRTLTAGLGR